MKFTEYTAYVQSRLIVEPNSEYTLMRCGLEMVEEIIEYLLDPSLDELGDCCYWLGAIASTVDWTPGEELEENAHAMVPNSNMMRCALSMAGNVKRLYRDKDQSYIDKIKVSLEEYYIVLSALAVRNHGLSLSKVFDSNKVKLDLRAQKKLRAVK